jgi:AmmeMemoRadiSam system protein B/AmmeMemoRadiSam system protein A
MRKTLTVLATVLLLAGCGDEKSGRGRSDEPAGPRVVEAAPVEASPPHRVRPGVLGTRGWFPSDAETLAETVDGHLEEAPRWLRPDPIAVIAPHAGYGYSGPVQGQVYATLRGRRYGRVFVLAVPHRAPVRGISIPDVTHYETPLGRVPLDRKAADRLVRASPFIYSHEGAHREEHSAEIQLPFLQRSLDDLYIVPMLVGVPPGYAHAAAAVIRQELKAGDLVVASSDSTHYGDNFGYSPFPADERVAENLRNLDMGAVDRILGLDLRGFADYKRETGITICGFSPICVLLALLPPEAKATLVGYDTSGRVTGSYRSSVSYVGVAFTGPDWGGEFSAADEKLALRLARESLTRYVTKGEVFDPVSEGWEIPQPLRVESGVFVTYKVGGELRGCIGDILPKRARYEAIVARAISSAAEDGRFPPVLPEEIEEIDIEISVLTPPRPVESAEGIHIGKHGILLHFDGQPRAVYLPQVAPEQGWSLEETLTHLSRKGGLSPGAWRSPRASFKVFEAEVFGEDD